LTEEEHILIEASVKRYYEHPKTFTRLGRHTVRGYQSLITTPAVLRWPRAAACQ
jgi:hypothetical protein